MAISEAGPSGNGEQYLAGAGSFSDSTRAGSGIPVDRDHPVVPSASAAERNKPHDIPIVRSIEAATPSAIANVPLADVVSFPRPRENTSVVDSTKTLTAIRTHIGSVTGAYNRGDTIVWGWSRTEKGGPIAITTSLIPPDLSPPKEPDGDADAVPETEYGLWPPGTKVTRLSDEKIATRNDGFDNWRRLEVVFTGTESSNAEQITKMIADNGAAPGLALDNTLLGPYKDSFRVETVAIPMEDEEVRKMLAKAHTKKDTAEAGRAVNSQKATEADKRQLQVGELETDVHEGRFKMAVVISAKDKNALDTVTGIVADAGSTELPYAITVNPNTFESWDDAVYNRPSGDVVYPQLTPLEQELYDNGVSAQMVTRWMPKPEGQLHGIGTHSRENYDVMVPAVPKEKRMPLGDVETNQDDLIKEGLVMSIDSLPYHVGVAGSTGSGKSMLLNLLAANAATGGNWEMHPDPEQAVLGDGAMAVVRINPKVATAGKPRDAELLASMVEPYGIKVTEIIAGDLTKENPGINPMDWGDCDPYKYATELVYVLANSYGISPGQDDHVSSETTLRYWNDLIFGKLNEFKGVYERFGWNIETGEPIIPGTNPPKPTLWDCIEVGLEAVQDQGYVGEATNVGPFFKQRTVALTRGPAGRFFGGEPLDTHKLFSPGSGITDIDISALDIRERSLIMGIMTLHYNGYLDKYGGPSMLSIDEANELVKEGPLGEAMGEMVRKNRSKKGGIVLAYQTPDAIPVPVLENLSTHFGMRLMGKEGQAAIQGQLMQTDEQNKELATFDEGEVVFRTIGMEAPVRGKTTHLDIPVGRGEVQLPRTKVKDGVVHKDHYFNGKEKIDMHTLLDKVPAGGKLVGLVEVSLATRLLGLSGYVGIDYDKARESGNEDYDMIRTMDPDQREYVVRTAVERAVASRTRILNRASYDREGLIEHMVEQVQAALDDDKDALVAGLDAGHNLPEYRILAVKGAMYGHLSDQIAAGQQQFEIPPLSKEELGLKKAIPGKTAFEQLGQLNQHKATKPVLIAKNPYSGGHFWDRAVESMDADTEASLKKSVDTQTEGAWKRKLADFLNELDFGDNGPEEHSVSPTRELLYNELHGYIDVEKESSAKKRVAPQAPPTDEQKATTEFLVAAAGTLTELAKKQNGTPSTAPEPPAPTEQPTPPPPRRRISSLRPRPRRAR